MKIRIFIVIIAAVVLLVSLQAGAEKKDDNEKQAGLDETIAYLLEFVRTSDVIFIRNGKEHSAEDAVKHIQKKYNHYKKKIKTPEDFIEKSATKSMMSGKLYQIKLKDGTVITCKDWLTAELERYRNPPVEAAADTTVEAAPADTASVEPTDTTGGE
jgi:hypothetical protein